MSDWDYGMAEQIAHEWDDAVKAGKCRVCIIHKATTSDGLCDRCENEIDEAMFNNSWGYE